ncbi:hypothetical protein CsSME_00001894 [Camellia sinensis var. sinensis]
MVCNSSFRFVILQAGHIERFTWGRVQLSNLGRSLNATWAQTYSKGHKFTKRGEMMVDSGATAKGGPTVDILREKDDDRSYASGGWKRWLEYYWTAYIPANCTFMATLSTQPSPPYS